MSLIKINSDDEIIKISDVAKLLKISESTIYKLTCKNEIPHRKVGQSVRFIKREVLNWFNAQRVG